MAELTGTDLNDNLEGTIDTDTLRGGAGNDFLNGRGGGDVLDGGEGRDTADYRTSWTAVTANLGNNTAFGGFATGDSFISIENIFGSAFDDTLTGDDRANILSGLSGDDRLNGGKGNDRLNGGDGADILNGGDGIDTADYRYAVQGVTVFLDGTAGSGGAAQGDMLTNIENLKGSSFADILTGNDADNILSRLGGDDQLLGGGGDDRLNGGAGADMLNGGDGEDTADYRYSWSTDGVSVSLDGSAGRNGAADGDILTNIENIWGSAHGDTLSGDAGNNILSGFDGNDTLSGLGGADTLTGGAGADKFVISNDNDMDIVTDFTDGTDRLVLEHDFGVFPPSFQDSGITLSDDGSDTVIAYDADGVGGNDAVDVMILTGVTSDLITISDFEFI